MRTLLLVALLAGCRAQTRAPHNAQLGESTAPGPAKPVDSPASTDPVKVDAPISGAVSPSDSPGVTPGSSDPPPDVP